jgi:putative ABC transport system substrate-binding protein
MSTVTRRAFLASSAALLAAPFALEAREPRKAVYKIGIISAGSKRIPLNDVFQEALRDLGWIDGQNIIIDLRLAGIDQGATAADVSAIAAQLADGGADVIVTYSGAVAQAVKKTVKTIPVCFGFVGDPIGFGLVTSLARPGGNFTGVSLLFPELGGKWLQLLKEAIPRLARVGVLVNPANPGSPAYVRATQDAARSLGIQLQIIEVGGLEEFERAFSTLASRSIEAVIPMSDTLFFFHRRHLIDLAAKHRLADIHEGLDSPKAGALMAYGEAFEDHMRRHAAHVDKLLRGSKPSELPVDQPTHLRLVINLKTAKALGLTIPASVLARADQVIE